MTWEPGQYLKYAGERLRPALDLMARVELAAPRPSSISAAAPATSRGFSPNAGRARTSSASTIRRRCSRRREQRRAAGHRVATADLAAWAGETPAASVDLVYSNAALHWLDDHATLFPRLMGIVARGGALAVQMPSNFSAPSHVALHDVANAPRWRARLAALLRPVPVAPAAQYFDWLSPHADSVDAWTTEYLHVLPPAEDGDHPVIAWMRGYGADAVSRRARRRRAARIRPRLRGADRAGLPAARGRAGALSVPPAVHGRRARNR